MWNRAPSLEHASATTAVAAVALYGFLLIVGTLTALFIVTRYWRTPIHWDTRSSSLCARSWSWRDAGGLLGILTLLFLAATLAAFLLPDPGEVTLVILQSMVLDLAGLTALLACLRFRGVSWTTAFGNPSIPLRRHLGIGAVFYLAILPLVAFSSLVYQGILSVNGYPPSIQEVAILLAQDHPVCVRFYLILLAIGLAPIFEECIFRGIALPLMARAIGTGPAILFTSALFAGIHCHLPSFVPLCVVAVGFSLGYLYSGSLWVPITMHALFNGVNVVLLTLMTS